MNNLCNYTLTSEIVPKKKNCIVIALKLRGATNKALTIMYKSIFLNKYRPLDPPLPRHDTVNTGLHLELPSM